MGVKRYFKQEFQVSSFALEHETPSDFYLGCFQRNREAWPLLFIRFILFCACLAIVIASQVLTVTKLENVTYGFWWIFLTHWGLLFITVTSGLAFYISLQAYIRGPIDGTFGLPWYVKLYWFSYNVAVPIAFFITVFYWIFLTDLEEEYAINVTLDIFIHAINSVLMFILVITNRHPTRILHFYHAVIVGIIYLIFSVIFHVAGGKGPFGTTAIYPMLYWEEAGMAAVTAAGSAVAIILMHLVVVALTAARDALSATCRNNSRSLSVSNERYY